MRTIARALLLALPLSSCAFGEGELASGEVEIALEPEGSLPDGFSADSLRLLLGGVEIVASEAVEEEGDGHGHGHSHLVAARSSLEDDHDDHDHDHDHDVAVDLLGADQELAVRSVRAGSYAELLLLSPSEGCVLEGNGAALMEDEVVMWELCLGPWGEAVTRIPFELEVRDRERHGVHLHLAIDRLFAGIDPSRLDRDAEGIVRIGLGANGGAASILQANLTRAISAH